MSKIIDDWMHPSSSDGWSAPKRDKDEYIIQRQRVIQCSWMGDGPPTQWSKWSSFDTRKERDDELKRLRATTTWRLRCAHYNALTKRETIEDEEWDLLRRLEEIRSRK